MTFALCAASLFFTTPLPLEMPRAEAYLVEEDGRYRLEDRYNRADLWYGRTVVGRWMDDAARVFTLAELAVLPPALDADATVTRSEYVAGEVPADRRDEDHLRRMLVRISPVAPAEKPSRPRQLPHGYRDVRYYQGTNTAAIVCIYLLERTNVWGYAAWELSPEDDFDERLGEFESGFLEKERAEFAERLAARGEASRPRRPAKVSRRGKLPDERELLRRDAAHSVAAYGNWHFTASDAFAILDDVPTSSGFVIALTNTLTEARGRFAAVMPAPVDGSNQLAVVRIFNDRRDYLDAIDEDMSWTAAYWSTRRREIVGSVPESGDFGELNRTFRHESFHQYLAYACSMIPASPWLNEGYAQYFEDESAKKLDLEVEPDRWDDLEQYLPSLLKMDYAEFYAGSDVERRTKYRLAWSIAVFLEKGADKVRFQPFKRVKADYLAALVRHRDMRAATEAAFGNGDRIKQFANEWRKFWQNGGLEI